MMRTKPPPSQATSRRCLKCGGWFPSEGFHNRICGVCNGRNDRLPRGAPRCRMLLRRTPSPQRNREEAER